MKNMKKILAYISVLAIAASFAACSKDGGNTTNSTTDTTSASDSANPENPEETTGGENPGGNAQGGPPEQPIQEIEMSPEYAEKCLNKVSIPEYTIKGDATSADFAGNWECGVMVKGEFLAYDMIFGVPLHATDHLVIAEDGTGVVQLVKDSTTTNETPFTYTVEDGKLIATVQVRTGPPAGKGGSAQSAEAANGAPANASAGGPPAGVSAGGPPAGATNESGASGATQGGPPAGAGQSDAGNTQGGPPPLTVTMQMTEDGKLLIAGEDADGDASTALYDKVESFTEFDFNSVDFDYSGLTK